MNIEIDGFPYSYKLDNPNIFPYGDYSAMFREDPMEMFDVPHFDGICTFWVKNIKPPMVDCEDLSSKYVKNRIDCGKLFGLTSLI